jgi:O-antigen ligase
VPGFHGAFSGNLMLDLLLEVGILGTVAFLAIVVVALVRAALSWRGSTTPRQRLVLATWVSVLVGGLLNAQAESVLSRVGGVGNLIFWLAVAICGAEDASSTTARVPRLAALAGRL